MISGNSDDDNDDDDENDDDQLHQATVTVYRENGADGTVKVNAATFYLLIFLLNFYISWWSLLRCSIPNPTHPIPVIASIWDGVFMILFYVNAIHTSAMHPR